MIKRNITSETIQRKAKQTNKTKQTNQAYYNDYNASRTLTILSVNLLRIPLLSPHTRQERNEEKQIEMHE